MIMSKRYKEKLLFSTNGQRVFHILNDGDTSEPAELCDGSLVRIAADTGNEIVCTSEELTELATKWLAEIE